MKIEFEVPDGEYCGECPMQEGFEVGETECVDLGDPYMHYMQNKKEIAGNCRLFNRPIQGKSLDHMQKCPACMEAAHE